MVRIKWHGDMSDILRHDMSERDLEPINGRCRMMLNCYELFSLGMNHLNPLDQHW